MITLNVTYSGLYVDAECDAVSGQIGVLRAQFSFTDDWNEFPEKTAVFCGSGSSVSVLLGDSLSCEVPSEVTEKPGKLVIGVFATVQDADGRIRRYPGKPATVEIGSGTPIVDTLPGDDEISSYEQLLYRLMAVEDALDESINRANTAAAGAESAAASADSAAVRATDAAVKAETNAESAKTAAEVATRTASAANKAAKKAEDAAVKAEEAASNATSAAQNAFNASGNATNAAAMANESVRTMSEWANKNIPKVLEARDEANEAASSANEAASSANAAAEAANEAAAFAKENGETAWNQAAYANEMACYAYTEGNGAKDVTWRAREAGQMASEAATLASMNSDFARAAGKYAYGIIGNLYRDAVLPFTEAEISETGEFSGFETNPDFYNTGKTYFLYKTDNGVSFKWTNPRPEKGSLKITMCAYGQYEEHFTSSMNVHYTDGTQDSFEFTHGVTVVYDTDKTKTVESMTGGPYVSDYGYQPWILLDMDVMSIIASYLIPQSDWLAEEGEAGHVLNRTHYQTVSNAPGYMPYDECDVEALGVGTHLVFKPTSANHFTETFVYESMRKADPFTYNIDYSCFYPPTGGEISFKYRAEQMVVNTLFTLIDTKNYRLVQFSSGVTAYVILDVDTLAEEYKSKFPEIGIYLDVEESVYTNRKITIQVVRVYRLNELYIPDTIARKTDIPGGNGDFIPSPSSASVGQTIRVSAVDENGKPTEWEAVDFPEGGGGSGEAWDYEKTITLTEDAGAIDVSEFDDGTPLALKKIRIIAITKNASSAGMNIRIQNDLVHNTSGGNISETSRWASANGYLYGHAYCEINDDGEVWAGSDFAVNVSRYIHFYSGIPPISSLVGKNGVFTENGPDIIFGKKASKITGYSVICTTGAFVTGSTFQIKGVRA